MARDVPILSHIGTIEGLLSVGVLVLVGGLALSFAVRNRPRVRAPLAVGISLDLCVLLAYAVIFGTLQTDEPIWHGAAVAGSETLQGVSDQGVRVRQGKDGYPWIGAVLYTVLTPMPLVLILLNVALHGLLILVVSGITRELADSALDPEEVGRGERLAAWAVALAPGIVLWTPQVMRETLSCLCVAITVLGLCRFLQRRNPMSLALPVLGVCLLAWVRSSVGAGLLVGSLLATTISLPLRSRAAAIARFALVGMGGAATFVGLRALGVFDLLEAESRAGDMSYLSRADTAFGGGSIDYSHNTWATILASNLPRVVAGPFVWEFRPTPGMIIAYVEGIMWAITVVLALLYLRNRRREAKGSLGSHQALLLVCLAFVLLLVFAVGISNYGMLSRLRPTALSCTIPPAALFIVSQLKRRRANLLAHRPALSDGNKVVKDMVR